MLKLVAHTPFGTFTRKTNTRYTHMALAYHADGTGVRVVGAAAIAMMGRGEKTEVQYLPKFSTSAAGALKLAQNYDYDSNLSVHGPYPVEVET
jgi:hypothetical protein